MCFPFTRNRFANTSKIWASRLHVDSRSYQNSLNIHVILLTNYGVSHIFFRITRIIHPLQFIEVRLLYILCKENLISYFVLDITYVEEIIIKNKIYFDLSYSSSMYVCSVTNKMYAVQLRYILM